VCGVRAQGYSAAALALALPADGMLVACEKDAAMLEVARRSKSCESWLWIRVWHFVIENAIE
jgi:hypothetical protein